MILSGDEVRLILSKVRLLRYRICLQTIYSCGLRLKEGTSRRGGTSGRHRQQPHGDSSPSWQGQQSLPCQSPRQARDRYVPLPKSTLEALRTQWKAHRNRVWIFPASGRGGIHRSSKPKTCSTNSWRVCERFKLELADIFRLHGPQYLEKFGDRMPPRHRTVMQKIEACRTEELGGEVFLCEPCQEYRYSYHSCQDRHCPKCGNDKADEWLTMQNALLLPVTYFMITVTLPDTLNAVTRRNQKLIYSIFFQTAAAALQKLAADPKFVGGQLGFFGVLQTWASRLAGYHPHIHFIVAGGGLSDDGNAWRPAHGKFLVPVPALSKIFRAKFRDALKKKPELFSQVPPETWQKDWVVHCEPVGTGERAIKYLAPYIFRVAISNRRLLKLENGKVTFQYRDGETKQFKTKTVSVEEFIRRFLQHVLPHRFIPGLPRALAGQAKCGTTAFCRRGIDHAWRKSKNY